MKIYRGSRNEDGCEIIVSGDGPDRPLDPRLDLWNHSPDGFEWGYEGSGPAQSALAILADVLDDPDRAVRLYQDFKRKVISGSPKKGWTLTEDQVMKIIEKLK
jgi:hypothetical protein